MQRKHFLRALMGLGLGTVIPLNKTYSARNRRIWTADDIKGGMYITRCYDFDVYRNGQKAIGLMGSVTYQIGWSNVIPDSPFSNGCYTMNSVTDGWVSSCARLREGYSKKSLADKLNNDQYGYIPTTQEDMIAIIKYLKKNFLK